MQAAALDTVTSASTVPESAAETGTTPTSSVLNAPIRVIIVARARCPATGPAVVLRIVAPFRSVFAPAGGAGRGQWEAHLYARSTAAGERGQGSWWLRRGR